MLNTNWKTWALIVIIAVGVMFEVLKHLPGRSAMSWSADNAGLTAVEKPYSVKLGLKPQRMRAAAQRLPPRMDSLVLKGQIEKFIAANKPAQTDFEHPAVDKGAEGKMKKKKKKKKDGEWEEYIDPVTGKKMRRRKKKQIAKEVKKEEPAQAEEKKPDSSDDKDIQAALDEAIMNGGIAPVQAKEDDVFADFEEWKRRLLTHPDLKATRLFIQQYQSRLVSDDIFYKITQLMVQDSRVEMKQLGVLCAGSSTSYLSFQILAGVAKKERAGSPLQNSCNEFLNHYADLPNLPILKKVLASNSDPFTTMTALKLLDKSVERYLTPAAPPANGQPATQNLVATNGPKFLPFMDVLKSLLTSRDVTVNDEARRTMTDLQARLGGGTAPTGSVPAPGSGPAPFPEGSLANTQPAP